MTSTPWIGALSTRGMLAVSAVINGALREIVLIPSLGDSLARLISAALVLGAIIALTFAFVHRCGPLNRKAA